MKLLFLRRKCDGLVGAPQKYHEFEQEVGKLCEARWAGEGWPLHRAGESMNETVRRLYGDDPPDWVIDSDGGLSAPRNRSYRVGYFTSDLHGKWSHGARTPQAFLQLLNRANYDAVFLKYTQIHGTTAPPNLFTKHLKPRTFFLPWSQNPDRYKPLEKTVDVTFLGKVGAVYPLRRRLWAELPEFCSSHGLTLIHAKPPDAPSFKRRAEDYLDDYYVGDRYTEALGHTRILVFGSSKYRYSVNKFFESIACNCLTMADEPSDAKELGFIDGKTFIKIDVNNWKQKLGYYANLEDERKKIANNGRKLFLEKHTHKIRARQFLNYLERF